jgi:UrcA family protein
MRHLVLTLAAAAGLAAAAPALAQTVEELTVTGHALRDRPQSLSETVSYADLDLNYARDRQTLRMRVNDTAGRICDRLNEARPSAGNLGHSCQEVAVRDAMGQVREAYADARSGPRYAETYGEPTSATVADAGVYTNGPIPDTPENRARYGAPMSRAGRLTGARGN